MIPIIYMHLLLFSIQLFIKYKVKIKKSNNSYNLIIITDPKNVAVRCGEKAFITFFPMASIDLFWNSNLLNLTFVEFVIFGSIFHEIYINTIFWYDDFWMMLYWFCWYNGMFQCNILFIDRSNRHVEVQKSLNIR